MKSKQVLTRNFAANLTVLREAAGLSKSDLARKLYGEETDSRGYTVARGRDRIGAWESGRASPTPDNLIKLAAALKVDPNVLAPDLVAASASKAPEAVSMRFLVGDASRAHIRVNSVLPTDIALQIMALVHKGEGAGPAEPAEGSGDVDG